MDQVKEKKRLLNQAHTTQDDIINSVIMSNLIAPNLRYLLKKPMVHAPSALQDHIH